MDLVRYGGLTRQQFQRVSYKMAELTKEQQELLKRLADEIMNLATSVVDDYEQNPSEMSGSITEVHIDSPILEDDDAD